MAEPRPAERPHALLDTGEAPSAPPRTREQPRALAGGLAAWGGLAALALLAVAFHVFMEWLFFATKPSFLTTLRPADKLLVSGTAALPLLLAALALTGLLALGAALAAGPPGPERERRRARWLAAGRAVPAVCLAITALLLLDNFTHTLFGFGLESFAGPLRHLYLLALAGLAVGAYRLLGGWQSALARSRGARRAVLTAAAAALGFSIVAFLLQREPVRPLAAAELALAPGAPARRPNILLLGGDGIDAAHLSLYGYRRPTSPFLERFAREALVCDRAFPNAANTGGSVISILTGRLPIDTGVIYPPDVVRGQAAYLHLPAILRRLGYRTAEISVRWYADGPDLNLRDAFDEANSRPVGNPRSHRLLAGLGKSGDYFLARMGERVQERLVHISTRRPWHDPYGEVTTQRQMSRRDHQRVDELLAFARSAREPWFLHVHLLGTHGSRFYPARRHFSRGREQSEDWMADFYDDAILGFDRHVERIVRTLAAQGLLERTIIVVHSDHNMNFTTARRTPLLFRFPGGKPAGRFAAAAQNLDIAPTLLDYLGVRKPAWMTGSSLLDPGLDPCRHLLSVASDARFHIQQGLWWVSVPRPPFYTLGTFSAVAGNRVFNLDLATGKIHTAPADLPPSALRCPTPRPAEVRALLVDRLRAAGYDTAPLER